MFANVLNALAATSVNGQDLNNVNNVSASGGIFDKLASVIGGWTPMVADLFLVVAVLSLVVCGGLLTMVGPQKVQQIKGKLLRIMMGVVVLMLGSYAIGFFAKSGKNVAGNGFSSGASAPTQTVAPLLHFHLSALLPSVL